MSVARRKRGRENKHTHLDGEDVARHGRFDGQVMPITIAPGMTVCCDSCRRSAVSRGDGMVSRSASKFSVVLKHHNVLGLARAGLSWCDEAGRGGDVWCALLAGRRLGGSRLVLGPSL
jgi:hypothetical protein